MKREDLIEYKADENFGNGLVYSIPEVNQVLDEKEVEIATLKAEIESLKADHNVELPDPPKPRRATNRELARWLAQGNGEYKEIITDHECCMTYFYYSDRGRDVELPKGIKVRRWSDTEWHEPTAEYLFGGDK